MIYLSGIEFSSEPHLFERLSNPSDADLERYSSALFRIARTPLALIITCNRAEVYSSSPINPESIERALGLNTLKVKKYRYSSDTVAEHLFMLSSGVLSPRFGEDTIISQIRRGGDASRNAMVSSSEISKLFNMAISFGKLMHSSCSADHLDSELIAEVVRKTDKADSILIIGSGGHARELAEALLKNGHSVAMTLRDMSKLFLIPIGATALSYDDRRSFVSSFDAVISASSGIYHTFEESDRNLFKTDLIFDLSAPPDLPSSFNAFTVGSMIGKSAERERIYNEVRKAADQYASEFRIWMECRESASAEAEDFAYGVMRRLKGVVGDLELSDSDKKSLQEAIFETVRKAFISELKSRKK